MSIRTQVCIAGGGPAGMMLGLLLARAGVDVVVLEKHDDFFRDFRGDTVHPSTMNVLDALGLRARFQAIEQRPLHCLDVVVDGIRIHAVDFRRLPGPHRFLTLMPQWDLLDLLAEEGRTHPSFHLHMGAEVTGVRRNGERVTGVSARTARGEFDVEADLTVAADGRHSVVRDAIGDVPASTGVPIDVLWFAVPTPPSPMPDTLAWISRRGMIVTIPRPQYLQCGMVIPKGAFAELRAAGIQAFQAEVSRAVPRLRDEIGAITSFDEVKLLSVRIDHLPSWSARGVLCIGDAAHAMSPAFGVGINYAVQDAVAASRVIVPAIRGGADHAVIDRAVRAVQRRRGWATVLMQQIQVLLHRAIERQRGAGVLRNPPTRVQRAVLRAVVPLVRRVLPRLIGYGFRPERLE